MTSRPPTWEVDPNRLELTAPAVAESLDLAHYLFEHLWAQHPEVSVLCRVRMETAALEIMGNIVEHAYTQDASSDSAAESEADTADGSGAGRRFRFTVAVRYPDVLVSFCDNGVPGSIDLSRVVMPDEDAESGRGLAMAIASVDEITYHNDGGRNYWSLRCEDR